MSNPEIPFTDLETLQPAKNGKRVPANLDRAITQAVDLISDQKNFNQSISYKKTVDIESPARWFWEKKQSFKTIKIEIVLTEEI